MPVFLLAVEINIDSFTEIEPIWVKHGITVDRIVSMQEAIEKVNHKPYIAIGINGDWVDYKPQLPILRDISSIPIHIIVNKFSYEDNLDAIQLGADIYTEWLDDKEKSIVRGLALFDRYNKRNSSKQSVRYQSYKNMVVYQDYRKVFICDKEVNLRKKEFDILLFLMVNRGKVLSHKQIYRRVWGSEFVDDPSNALWTQINHLRKAICAASSDYDLIETVIGVGYRFKVDYDK